MVGDVATQNVRNKINNYLSRNRNQPKEVDVARLDPKPTLQTISDTATDDNSDRNRQHTLLRRHLSGSPTGQLNIALDALKNRQGAVDHNVIEPLHHAIVVLGVPTLPDGSASVGLIVRIQRAAEVAFRYPHASVIVTGGAVANNHPEATCMAEGLVHLGVARERIIVESHAHTTLDNAAFTISILRNIWPIAKTAKRDPTQLTVVSEPYHAMRSLRHFAAAQVVFDFPATLYLAASLPGQVAQLQPTSPRTRIRTTTRARVLTLIKHMLPADSEALLQRCIEEKRRIMVGW